jgi:hypothetical protein
MAADLLESIAVPTEAAQSTAFAHGRRHLGARFWPERRLATKVHISDIPADTG